ncbi:MAG: DsrE family protein, partial [Candidatus Manganitrophaceae bacterium]
MANKVLVIFEKPIYLSFEPVDPHLFATALGVSDTPVEINVLLRDSAVTYGVKNQKVNVKVAGQDIMLHETAPDKVMTFMAEHGAKISAVAEDMKSRGINKEDLVQGIEVISEDDSIRL